MILKLKSPQAQFPNMGWPFRDARTGFEVKGVAAFEQTAQGLAAKIIKNRRANPHLYPAGEAQWFDLNTVVQEVFVQKQATHPELFVNHEASLPAPVVQPVAGLCKFCGSSDVAAVMCKTCGPRKVKNFHCNKCGKDFK